eukprot:3654632-Amphidinium_carterae.1
MSELSPSIEGCVLGQILFNLHSCARWSDTLPLSGEPSGDGFLLSAESKLTKTSRGIKRLRVPVPFLALADGISGYAWGRVWLASRQSFAPSADPSLLSVDSHWNFAGRHMSSDEATSFLLHFLDAAGTPATPGQNIGSHCLKSTLLAWAARWPMKASMRRLLGKHSDRKDHTMLVYSRDSCLAAMHHLAAMVADIRSGVFDPDASRSVILRGKHMEPELIEHCPIVEEDDALEQAADLEVAEVRSEAVPEHTEPHEGVSDSSASSASSLSDDDLVEPDGSQDSSRAAALGDYLLNPK